MSLPGRAMVARLKRRERKRVEREIMEAIERGRIEVEVRLEEMSAAPRALAAAVQAVYDAKVLAGTATADDAYHMWWLGLRSRP